MSDGFTVTIVFKLKPEAVEAFCSSIPELLKDTRAFAGFRDIRVLRNKDNPSQVILIEDWDTHEAYEAYIAWRTETGTANGMDDIIVAPPQRDFWDTRVA